MATRNRPYEKPAGNETSQTTTHEKVKNPFENHRSAEKDIEEAKEDLKKEQEYKEALTERD